jgi:hypothetical protein
MRMRENYNELNNGVFADHETKRLKDLGLSSTLGRIAKMEREHQQIYQEFEATGDYDKWRIKSLENGLEIQHDYIRKVCRAVEYRNKAINRTKAGNSAEWKIVLKWLKKQSESKLSKKQSELLRCKLFSLIDREKAKKETLARMGKLGEILNHKKLVNLASFSEGGFFDASDQVCEHLENYEAQEITKKAVKEAVNNNFVDFLAYEVKEIVLECGGDF